MARRSRMSVQKRKRERDKAERAAMKREGRLRDDEGAEGSGNESAVATHDDLEGYGLIVEPEDAEEAEQK